MPKILLIISIVLIIVAAGFGFATLESKIPALKNELATTQGTLKTTEGDLDKSKSEVKATKTQLDKTSDDLRSTKADLETTQKSLADEKSKASDLQAKVDADESKIKDLTSISGTGSGPGTSENVLAAPLAEAQSKVKELEQVNQTLATKVTEAENVAKDKEAEIAHYKGQIMAKGLQGQVLAVNGAYNFVVLSIGDKQGVVMNAQMIVVRGDRMVAKVKITSVEPSTSIADIVPGSGTRDFQVQPGDRVVYSGA